MCSERNQMIKLKPTKNSFNKNNKIVWYNEQKSKNRQTIVVEGKNDRCHVAVFQGCDYMHAIVLLSFKGRWKELANRNLTLFSRRFVLDETGTRGGHYFRYRSFRVQSFRVHVLMAIHCRQRNRSRFLNCSRPFSKTQLSLYRDEKYGFFADCFLDYR